MRRRLYRGRLCLKLIDPTGASSPPPSSSASAFSSSAAILGGEETEASVEGQQCWDLVLQEEFLGMWVVQPAYVASTVLANPGARLGEGRLTVFVIRPMSRLELLALLLSMDSGGHVSHPRVVKYHCSAYRYEPVEDEPPAGGKAAGIYSLDGESVEYAEIEAVLLARSAMFLSLK
jgi:hypothetical protein